MIKLQLKCPFSQTDIVLDPEKTYVIGRKDNSDVCIPDSSISRFHARIEYHREGWVLSDLNSTNGTFIGEEKIREKLIDKDIEIRFGKIPVSLIVSEETRSEEIVIKKEPVNVVKKENNSILQSKNELSYDDRLNFYSNNNSTLSQNYVLPVGEDQPKKTDNSLFSGGNSNFLDIPDSLSENGGVKKHPEQISKNIGPVSETDYLQNNLFNIILDIPKEMEKLNSVDEKLEYSLDLINEFVSGCRKLFLLYDPFSGWQMKKFLSKDSEKHNPFVSRNVIDKVLETKEPFYFSDVKESGEVFTSSESIALENVTSLVAIPLNIKGNIDGIFIADSNSFDCILSDNDFKIAQILVSHLWQGILVSIIEEREKETEKSYKRLSRYLSPNVVKHIISDENACKLGGELKEVTVLFSDLRGFTSMSEKMKPKDIIGDLNDYLRIMLNIIFAHKGTVDKFMGDAIMCFWGAPLRTDKDALLAVQSAWQMQQELHDFNVNIRETNGKPPLKMGIGINTGWVVCGNIGSHEKMEYTLIGDSVNIAQRIESMTKETGKDIIISETTYLKTKGYILSEELESVHLKGKRYSTRLYSLEGIS